MWKQLSSKYIYKNPWIKVREDKVLQPDKVKAVYGVIEPSDGVSIVAVDKRRNIYLVGQTRYPVNDYTWEVPNGGKEKGETPLAAAKRELLEETGLVAKKWVRLGRAYPYAGLIKETDDYFFAYDLVQGKTRHDGSEDITVKKVKFQKALNMIKNGEILDAQTITAIMKYVLFISNRK